MDENELIKGQMITKDDVREFITREVPQIVRGMIGENRGPRTQARAGAAESHR